MKKVFSVLLCTVLLFVSLSLPFSVSAESGSVYFNPTYVRVATNGVAVRTPSTGNSWPPAQSYTFTQDETTDRGVLRITDTRGIKQYKVQFIPTNSFPSFSTPKYMQLDCYIILYQTVSQNFVHELTGALYMTDSTVTGGTTFEFPVTQVIETDPVDGLMYYIVRFGGVAEVGEGFDLKDQTYTFSIAGYTNTNSVEVKFGAFDYTFHEVYEDETVDIVDTVEKGFDDLLAGLDNLGESIKDGLGELGESIKDGFSNLGDSIDESTEEITDSIEESTDTIVNGWESDDGSSGEIDNITGDMEKAESDALGGKTDKEIQAEVDNVLNNDNIPKVDHTGVIGVAGVFDKALSVFGQDYQSLLVLSLTLGFAAFLVGRQYRAKGD